MKKLTQKERMLRLGGSGRGTQTMLHFVGRRLRCSIKGSCYQSTKEPQNGSISLNNEQVDGRAVWKLFVYFPQGFPVRMKRPLKPTFSFWDQSVVNLAPFTFH